MPEKNERSYIPNKLYEVKVKIKDLDYTNDTIEVVIASSLNTAYQIIDITFSLDPNDAIVEDIFGGEPIRLSITLFSETIYPGPRIDIELLYLNSGFELTEKDKMTGTTLKDRTNFTVTTVARNPFKTMSSLVNGVYIGKTLNQIVTSLATDIGATVSYDSDDQNTISIDQVCIPPTTFYKIIKENNRQNDDIFDGYLDQRFGLFSGSAGVFCQYDNKVYIKNLTSKLRKNQTFTVHQLASGENAKIVDKIYDQSLDGKVFYTYDSIHTSYAGNAKFGDLGSSIRNIVRPKDTLTAILPQELVDVASSSALLYSSRNKKLFIDSASERTKYYNEDTGYEQDLTLFNSQFGRSLSTLSSISLNLERNLPLLNLINVGECVKFKPHTVDYIDFEGKYILWSSIISFMKEGPDWQTTAQINLYRTNKKK